MGSSGGGEGRRRGVNDRGAPPGAGCRQGAGRRRLGAGTFLEDEVIEAVEGTRPGLDCGGAGGRERGRDGRLWERLWSRPPCPRHPSWDEKGSIWSPLRRCFVLGPGKEDGGTPASLPLCLPICLG